GGGVVIGWRAVAGARFREGERGKAVYQRALERIATLPGVQQVSVASTLPLTSDWQIGVRVEGAGENEYFMAYGSWVSNDHFRAMGIPLKSGRSFTDEDRADTTPVVVINEA